MENKDYINKVEGGERRFLDVEFRAEKESRMIEGYAIVFNKDSENLGGFIERILPEAVDGRLNDDVVALLNHDSNFVLARNGGTMELTADENGVKYRFEAPNTTAGNDLLENVRLGNIRKSSFAFTISEGGDNWETRTDGPDIRTISKIKRLYDVSPVTYPAYPDTSVAQRSFKEQVKEEENKYIYNKSIKKRKLNLKRR